MTHEEVDRLITQTTKRILGLPIERLEMIHSPARINHPLTLLMLYRKRGRK